MNKWIEVVLSFFKGLNSTLQLVLIGLVVFTIAYSFGSCGKKTQIEEYNQRYRQYQQEVTVAVKRADSLEKVVKARLDSAARDSITAVKQTARIDSLKKSLNKTETSKTRLQHEIDSLKAAQPDTSAISLKKDTLIINLRTDSATMKNTIVELEKRDTTRLEEIAKHKQNTIDEKSRADSLEAKLKVLPKPPKDPDKWFFGLLPKPNRIVVGAVSATVGLVAGVLLVK